MFSKFSRKKKALKIFAAFFSWFCEKIFKNFLLYFLEWNYTKTQKILKNIARLIKLRIFSLIEVVFIFLVFYNACLT